MRRTAAALAAIVWLAAGTAHAQPRTRPPQTPPRPPARTAPPPPAAPPERLRILIDGGVQFAPASFHQNFTLTENVEDMPVTTALKLRSAGFVDGGVLFRVNSGISIGGVGFFATGSTNGTVDAEVPHPFYFNQPREVSGTVSALSRREYGAHVMLAHSLRVSRTGEVTIFGGPSYFHIEQALVTDVSYSDTYPYDTATFIAAPTSLASHDGFGFNAGAEATWRIAPTVRAGALVRYSQANVTLSAAPGNTADVRAGGIQVGASLRVIVARKPPAPRRAAPPPPPRRGR